MSEHVNDLLALYALGGLEADELQAVNEHLAECASCRAEADQQLELVGQVASSVAALSPDPRLRAEVLAKAGLAPRPAAAAPRAPAKERPARQPLRLARPGWLAAFSALLAVSLIGWNVYLTSQVMTLQHRVQYNQNALALIAGANTTHMPLVGQGTFATAGGNAYVDQKTQNVVLVVQQLKPLGPGQTYQAWIIDASGPVSAGLFRVSDMGWGMTWLSMPYVQGGVIGVSLEPNGGSPKPTQVVLISAQ
jgi:anti-sigma-K factor RskA